MANPDVQNQDEEPPLPFLLDWRKRDCLNPDVDEAAVSKKLKRDHNVNNEEDALNLDDTIIAKCFGIPGIVVDHFRAKIREKADKPTAEFLLNQKGLINCSPLKYDEALFKHYSRDASSFKASSCSPIGENPGRRVKYRAFLGPSGCGKTFSALKARCENEKNLEYKCTAYVAASSLHDPNLPFVDRVDKLLKNYLLPDDTAGQKLQILLHLVIDEAGFDETTNDEFQWSVSEVHGLREKILEWVEDVEVTATGTNLDAILTASTDSSTDDIIKYHAVHWDAANVKAILPGILKHWQESFPATAWPELDAAEEQLLKWIAAVPVFGSLQTNARAAGCLVSTLLRLMSEGRDALLNVQYVVESVSRYYINQNGLQRLNTLQRRRVVQAVLKVLTKDYSTEQAAPATFDIEANLLRHCLGIVDSNVDKIEGHYKYINEDWKSPCSVSPCLTIVMFELIGVASRLATDWSSFETVCTLALIQNTVMQADAATQFRLIEMQEPFPHGSAVLEGHVPLIGSHDVVRNGPLAPHGDGFAHYEIMQSKHAKKRDTVKFYFWEELYNSGLLNVDDSSINVATTALLHQQWKEDGCLDKYALQDQPAVCPSSEPTLNGMYPASLLETVQNDSPEVVKFFKKVDGDEDDGDEDDGDEDDKWVLRMSGDEESIVVPQVFHPAITFSICTNAETITVIMNRCSKEEKTQAIMDLLEVQPTDSQGSTVSMADVADLTITSKDVDFDGSLLDSSDDVTWLRNMIVFHLRGGVNMRFRFCRGM